VDIKKKENVDFFHQVVDCQYACPAHTPVPEYIRLIAQGKYTEAYMVNWQSNVFPGILGRTCDRPCEPACRRGRIEEHEEPVAICRLKRVAADKKTDITSLLPEIPKEKNGKKVALIGAGPASLTVARDLAPLGYDITLFDEQTKGGGMIRSQIPSFRLPDEVLDEEVNYVLNMGINTFFNQRVDSLKNILEQDFDAVFIGTGAPKGRDLDLPGRMEGNKNIHIGVEWLANVAFKHTDKIGKKVIVLGGGNTAMDCCRTALRLGGSEVTVTVRSPFATMKASPWEIEDAQHEGIPILDNHVPKEFIIENDTLVGMRFEKVEAVYDKQGNRSLIPTGEAPVIIPCDDVLIAVGQSNSFPWIERDLGIAFNKWDMPKVNRTTFATTLPNVFVGGDAAFGPENVITAVAHGHQAAISIDLHCQGKDVNERPQPGVSLLSQKMGVHEWSYDSQVSNEERNIVPLMELKEALKDLSNEVELGFDEKRAISEAARCLNCDMQTVFTEKKCIECDACVDVCPTKVLTMTHKESDETSLRNKLTIPAKNLTQPLYVSDDLATGRVMVKDEDLCLHCGLCAERCPTGAWDLQQFTYNEATACGNLAQEVK